MIGNGNGNGNGSGDRPRLTGLQMAFVDHWFDTRFNATEAAARAGYQGDRNTLASIGSENLRKPNIRAEIARRWEAHGGTREEVIAHLVDWMRFDMAILFDAHGNLDWEQVRQHGRMIKRIEWIKGSRLKVEVHDPLKAAELIAKHLLVEEQAEAGGLTIIMDI